MKQMLIDAYMKPLYDQNPTGELLERAKNLEAQLHAFGDQNPQSMDLVGDSGLRDVYNQLYMDVLSGQNTAAKAAEPDQPAWKMPTVGEFLSTYRHVYEASVREQKRPLTDQAYAKLFDVENRTDDLVEAQIIIEKEYLVLGTVTADYKAYAQEFAEAVDPNYEVTSAAMDATFGVYQTATSLDEITYMGEIASAVCDDLAVQLKVKVEMMQTLQALLFAWEHAKRKIREGEKMEDHARAMVVTRRKTRAYYRFLEEDMGITFDTIENTPFYRILMLNPEGLDALWRLKRIMHPDNLKAMRYVLFEEILSDKPLSEILMTAQPYAYYEAIDNRRYPEVQKEFLRIAEEENRDIPYFQKHLASEETSTLEGLMEKAGDMRRTIVDSIDAGVSALNGFAARSSFTTKRAPAVSAAVSKVIDKAAPTVSANSGAFQQAAGTMAKSAAKEVGKGLLRGLFRK